VKVQILTLETHDDRNTVLDRLGWVQANRVVLVCPVDGSPLRTRLDLALVQRRARNRAVQVGLVTHDPLLREAARSLNIPVFDSAEEMPERDWRRRGSAAPQTLRRAPAPASLRDLRPAPRLSPWPSPAARLWRIVAFSVALFALATALVATLPAAQVTLDPLVVVQSRQLEILISAEGPPGELTVPAEWRSVRVTGSLRLPTSGTARVPDGLARGRVTFTNLTAQAVDLPAGTGVRTLGERSARFVTTDDARLPAEVGALLEIPIAADAPGSSGNVPALAIAAVEGSLGLQVAVSNSEPTSGGSETTRAAVAAADLQRTFRDLQAELELQAAQALTAELEPGRSLARQSLRVAQEYQRAYDAAPGDAADTLALTLDLQMTGLVYEQAAVEASALAALEQEMPGTATVPGSFSLDMDNGPITDRSGRTTIQVTARRRAAATIDSSEAAAHIAGRSMDDAAAWLSANYRLRRPASISVQPSFLHRLPLLTYRISVRPSWESAP